MRYLFLIFCIAISLCPAYADEEFEIRRGQSSSAVAHDLEARGLIKSATLFKAYLKMKGADSKLRAGFYMIPSDASYKELTEIFLETHGAASLTSFTIPEGFTLIEISQELEEKGIIRDSKAFLTYVNRDAKDELIGKFPFLSEVPGTILEGYLFPETYVLAKRSPYKKVVAAFLTQFQKQALPLYRAADTPLSLHETMTLASIVEKESFGHKEMRKISGVFHNRLKQRMLLASCPTVAYALGDPRKRTLSYKDLEVKSPYNTYRNRGLPPTPIAASGTLAIKAALYPVETPYLYFIANGDGTHTFTKTLAEHLKRQRVLMGH